MHGSGSPMSSKDSKPTWFDRLIQLLTALGGGAGLVALLAYFLGEGPFKSPTQHDSEGSETVNSSERNQVGSLAGTWTGPDGLSCDFVQGANNQFSFNCTRRTVQGVVTSQGQGQIVGNQSKFQYSTSLGTTGTGQMTLTSDGQKAYGSSVESNGVKISLYLVKQN